MRGGDSCAEAHAQVTGSPKYSKYIEAHIGPGRARQTARSFFHLLKFDAKNDEKQRTSLPPWSKGKHSIHRY